jgi:predicted metal-dependent hydrolase
LATTVDGVIVQEPLFAVPEPDINAAAAPAAPVQATPPIDAPQVEIRRSARRRRTVSAHRVGDTIVVSVPARMSRADEARYVEELVGRIVRSERKLRRSDSELEARAAELSSRYLGGRATPSSVRWVDNMVSRWGSCTPVDGTIRLSRRLDGMPAYVVDYVLLHELAHLLVPGHGAAFWSELGGFERLERARGFLEGVGSVPIT